MTAQSDRLPAENLLQTISNLIAVAYLRRRARLAQQSAGCRDKELDYVPSGAKVRSNESRTPENGATHA